MHSNGPKNLLISGRILEEGAHPTDETLRIEGMGVNLAPFQKIAALAYMHVGRIHGHHAWCASFLVFLFEFHATILEPDFHLKK